MVRMRTYEDEVRRLEGERVRIAGQIAVAKEAEDRRRRQAAEKIGEAYLRAGFVPEEAADVFARARGQTPSGGESLSWEARSVALQLGSALLQGGTSAAGAEALLRAFIEADRIIERLQLWKVVAAASPEPVDRELIAGIVALALGVKDDAKAAKWREAGRPLIERIEAKAKARVDAVFHVPQSPKKTRLIAEFPRELTRREAKQIRDLGFRYNADLDIWTGDVVEADARVLIERIEDGAGSHGTLRPSKKATV